MRSLDIADREKMEALNELIKMEKENKRRDILVLVVSIIVNTVIALVVRFL